MEKQAGPDVDKEVFREAFKKVYLTRGRYRTSRRSISDVIKLGLLARELADYYMTVVEWNGFKRVLKIDIGVKREER